MLMLGGKQPKTGFPRRLRCMINTLHKGKTLKDLPPRFQIKSTFCKQTLHQYIEKNKFAIE